MSKKQALPIDPSAIMGDLIAHTKDEKLLARLEAAGKLLPDMAAPQYERCVSDALAGTVATIVCMLCTGKNNAPVIMVVDAANKKEDVPHLKAVVHTLDVLGYLQSDTEVTVREANDRYLCTKRLQNALSNGCVYPESFGSYLTIDRLPKADAANVCVKTCGKSCGYYGNCRYQALIQHLSEGRARIQVYGTRQYKEALRNGTLPKTRMTVYSPAEKRVLAVDSVRTIAERELNNLLGMCEKGCGSNKRCNAMVYRATSEIREDSRVLFSMAVDSFDKPKARRLLENITGRLEVIRDECSRELALPKNKIWKRILLGKIEKAKAMLESDFDITHKDSGKRTLIAA